MGYSEPRSFVDDGQRGQHAAWRNRYIWLFPFSVTTRLVSTLITPYQASVALSRFLAVHFLVTSTHSRLGNSVNEATTSSFYSHAPFCVIKLWSDDFKIATASLFFRHVAGIGFRLKRAWIVWSDTLLPDTSVCREIFQIVLGSVGQCSKKGRI
jgi:hypothetical protein